MASTKIRKFKCIPVVQGTRTFYLAQLPASLVTRISYAAIRGKDEEEGAIQRVLNTRRIASVRDFTLQGGSFPSSLVLNWVSKSPGLVFDDDHIEIADKPRAAQIIDGQHRIAGIEAAIEEDPKIGSLQLPVAFFSNLSTQQCADIFLSINTEQKTVSRSLVFDLFGVASENMIDHVALRARDVAMFLHESEDSPYVGAIKLPGAAQRKGGIALSTVVAVLKPLVDDKGSFEQYDLRELETQKRVVLNLFRALHAKYGEEEWNSKSNVFLYASGFSAAVRFLQVKMLPLCAANRDFSQKRMAEAIRLEPGLMVGQGDLRGLGGGDSINKVYEALVEVFVQKSGLQRAIKL